MKGSAFAALRAVARAFAFAFALLLSACASVDRLSLQSREFNGGGGDGSRPLRLVHISDLHAKASSTKGGEVDPVYAALADRLRAARPDLVLITGDLIDDPGGLEAADEILGLLGDETPKFAVMGNHDYDAGREALASLYAAHTCRLLVNDYADFEFEGKTVRVYGADDLLRGEAVPPDPGLLGEGLALILCHEPGFMSRLGPGLRGRKGTFAFAGHTHGGQVTFFGLPLVLPEESRPYVTGEYRVGEIRLFVSRGVGTSRMDLRIFARPDIMLILIEP